MGATSVAGTIPRALLAHGDRSPAPVVPVCRCAQEPLAAYYGRADEVLLARLARAEDHDDGVRTLTMVAAEIPWKVSPMRRSAPLIGDTIVYRTGVTTAECGVPAEVGAVYVVFAQPPAEPGTALGVDTCSGTRVHVGSAGGG